MLRRNAGALLLYLGLLASLGGTGAWGGLALEERLITADRIDGIVSPFRHNTFLWEVEALTHKLASKLWAALGGGDDQEAVLRRFFQLSAQLRGQRSPAPSLLAEHLRLRNTVEKILEGRITRLLEEEGLTIHPPLFEDWEFVFPPVAVELAPPPAVLAVSPREVIRLERSVVLSPGLDLATRQAIEAEVDSTGVSSLVVDVGGMATYPSSLQPFTSYGRLVEIAIHEWLHHYLALFPLGRQYFRSPETRALNETVADLAAQELVRKFLQMYPSPEGEAGLPSPPPRHLYEELRALRRQVEALLAAGQVEEAEGLMERKRQELAQKGFYFRKINQAFFAFYGLYAESPASISPLGEKLRALRAKAGSLRRFLELVSGITSEEELDALLARLP